MILLIGCGLAAFSVAKILDEKKIKFHQIGDLAPNASQISSGILNPISGRKMLVSWHYENLKKSALYFYAQFEDAIEPIEIYKKNLKENIVKELYLSEHPKMQYIEVIGKDEVKIKEAYRISIEKVLNTILKQSIKNKTFTKKLFDYNLLKIHKEYIEYQNKQYSQIIFAEGAKIHQNPFFNFLPYIPNRGQAIHLKIDNFQLIKSAIHNGKFLCNYKNNFWVGSSFENLPFSSPTHSADVFNELLKSIPKLIGKDIPYEIIEHLGAFRLASHDRRPYVGPHPNFGNIFIFNGFGTKGALLIPHYANQLVENILFNCPIDKEVQLDRIKMNKKYHSIK